MEEGQGVRERGAVRYRRHRTEREQRRVAWGTQYRRKKEKGQAISNCLVDNRMHLTHGTWCSTNIYHSKRNDDQSTKGRERERAKQEERIIGHASLHLFSASPATSSIYRLLRGLLPALRACRPFCLSLHECIHDFSHEAVNNIFDRLIRRRTNLEITRAAMLGCPGPTLLLRYHTASPRRGDRR